MINNLIGIDFSIAKPAACIFTKKRYNFISWPYNLKESLQTLYKNNGINIVDRIDDRSIKHNNISAKMRFEIQNSVYLADLIFKSLKPYLNNNTIVGFESMSYGSSGDVVIQLGAYKYILMEKINQIVPLKNMFTFAPITIKKTASCSKRGMNKNDVINSFLLESSISHPFHSALNNNTDLFKKKNSINWQEHIDDLIDSYFIVKTLENFLHN